jgi:hypothetical protein
MLSFRHRFAITILFVITQILVADNTEMAKQTSSLAYSWKTDQPKPTDPDVTTTESTTVN